MVLAMDAEKNHGSGPVAGNSPYNNYKHSTTGHGKLKATIVAASSIGLSSTLFFFFFFFLSTPDLRLGLLG